MGIDLVQTGSKINMNVKQHVRANIQRKGRKMGQVELAQVNKVLSDEEMYGDTSLLGDENDKGDEDKASKKAADDIKKELPKQAKVIPVSAGGQALLITGATHARELLSM